MVLHDNGVIVHTLDHGALIDERIAVEVIDATKDIADGRRVAVVVDLRSIAFADRGSRQTFASDPSGGIEVATALVATARVAEFMASQFVTTAKPERPTAIFKDVEEASRWAADQVQSSLEA